MKHQIHPDRLKHCDEDEKEYLAVHEVYYNKAGQIRSWSVEPVQLISTTSNMHDLQNLMAMITKDIFLLQAPVLEFNMEPEGEMDDPS